MRHAAAKVQPIRRPVQCICGHKIFDGLIIRTRVVRVLAKGAEAKCRCRRWLAVPVSFDG